MEALKFETFCCKIADAFGTNVIFDRSGSYASTSVNTVKGKPSVTVSFSNWGDDRQNYHAEFYSNDDKAFYLGAIESEVDQKSGAVTFEHFEVGVSPSGKYDEHNSPVEGQGELWQFYYGVSLGWAIRSMKMGGARKWRKPIRVW